MAHRTLDRRQARDQEHDHQHEVGAGQSGEAAAEGGDAAGFGQVTPRLGANAQRERHAHADPDQPGEDIGVPRIRRMPGAMVQRWHPAVAAAVAGGIVTPVGVRAGAAVVGRTRGHARSVGEQPWRTLGAVL